MKQEKNIKISYKEFDRRIEICENCKHFDSMTDFPNIWCNKNTEILNCYGGNGKTFTYTDQKKCPLNKF